MAEALNDAYSTAFMENRAWLLDTDIWCTLDWYGDLVDFDSLEISGLITNWREVISLFNFCKMLLSDTCMKTSP